MFFYALVQMNDRGYFVKNEQGKVFFLDRKNEYSVSESELVKCEITFERDNYGFIIASPLITGDPLDVITAPSVIYKFKDAVVAISDQVLVFNIDGCSYSLPVSRSMFRTITYKWTMLKSQSEVMLILAEDIDITNENILLLIAKLWKSCYSKATLHGKVLVFWSLSWNGKTQYRSREFVLLNGTFHLVNTYDESAEIDITENIKSFFRKYHIALHSLYHVRIGGDDEAFNFVTAEEFELADDFYKEKASSLWEVFLRYKAYMVKHLSRKMLVDNAYQFNENYALGLETVVGNKFYRGI